MAIQDRERERFVQALRRELETDGLSLDGVLAHAAKMHKDAERYRKWRAHYTGGEATEMLIAIADAWEPAQVDAAIDAAPAVCAA